jgi:hypothetical protein
LTDAPLSAGLVALADRIELWPIDRTRPYERNPRTHSDVQFDQIAASMVEFGWTNPVEGALARTVERDDHEVAGHPVVSLAGAAGDPQRLHGALSAALHAPPLHAAA